MINFFNTDCIYNLKYNNTELLKNNNKSTTEITRVPNFVETLYITKHTFLKFNLYCSMYKKDIKKIIPPHTKIIFFEDVSDKNFYSKLV